MKYCRINLSKTNYQPLKNSRCIVGPQLDVNQLQTIYKKYCEYKQFDSVVPIFKQQIMDPWTDVIGYYDENNLVAFSLIKHYDIENAEALQFAWDYANPNLRLGIESLKNECAIYKARGYKYLYLGLADKYKEEIDGFELLGRL
jgi:hypothetical protein